MDNPVVTVEQLNKYIKSSIESLQPLRDISVKGEISNCTVHSSSGHIYFTLKDSASLVKAVMFKPNASKLDFKLENGIKVICRGYVTVFVRDGQYQLYVESVQPDGIGSLYIAFEQLKARLAKEGLFADSHKKKLPKIPLSVGIITSPTGAAIRDMINVSGRRFPASKLLIYPATVQGANAPPQLIAAIKYFNTSKNVDVIIIGRGGGSLEELWAFNDEGLARAIYNSNIPVVSAVGHETDFTICDFVADLRAPTPSAAAEIVFPDSADMKRMLGNVVRRMNSLLTVKLSSSRRVLDTLASSRSLSSPKAYLDDKQMTVASLEHRLAMAHSRKLDTAVASVRLYEEKLKSLNPLSVLSRGYSVVFNNYGNVIKSINDVKKGDNINMSLKDGSISACVEEIF